MWIFWVGFLVVLRSLVPTEFFIWSNSCLQMKYLLSLRLSAWKELLISKVLIGANTEFVNSRRTLFDGNLLVRGFDYSLWVLVTSCGRERRWVFVRCTFQKLHWPELLRRVMWPRNCCTFERRACFLCTACCNGVDFGKHVIMGWRDP